MCIIEQSENNFVFSKWKSFWKCKYLCSLRRLRLKIRIRIWRAQSLSLAIRLCKTSVWRKEHVSTVGKTCHLRRGSDLIVALVLEMTNHMISNPSQAKLISKAKFENLYNFSQYLKSPKLPDFLLIYVNPTFVFLVLLHLLHHYLTLLLSLLSF